MEHVEAIRKQIEYYFSDDNLKHDNFFQTEMKKTAENWLEASFLLNCSKIKALNVESEESINDALKESDLKTKTENGKLYIRREEALPSLVPRNKRTPKIPTVMLVAIEAVPEDVNWMDIKQAMIAVLANAEGCDFDKPIRHVSRPDSNGRVIIAISWAAGDWYMRVKEGKLVVNNASLNCIKLEGSEYEAAVKIVPAMIFVEERRRAGAKSQNKNRQMVVGGATFASDKDLFKRARQWLEQHPVGTDFDEYTTEFKILKDLLAYHPRAIEKGLNEVQSFGIRTYTGASGTETDAKAFHILKADGSSEDFSVKKCIERLVEGAPRVDTKQEEVSSPVKREAPSSCVKAEDSVEEPVAKECKQE